MTDRLLAEHMRTVEKRMRTWLAKQTPEDRIDALADLRDAISSLTDLEQTTRRETLIELVDTNGLEVVAESLEVSPTRLMRIISPKD